MSSQIDRRPHAATIIGWALFALVLIALVVTAAQGIDHSAVYLRVR